MTVSGCSLIAIIMAYSSCPQRRVRCLFFYFHFLKHLCYVINWITMDEFAQNTKEVKQSALQGLWSSRTLGAASQFLPRSVELADVPLTFHVSNILRKHLSSWSWGAHLPVHSLQNTRNAAGPRIECKVKNCAAVFTEAVKWLLSSSLQNKNDYPCKF